MGLLQGTFRTCTGLVHHRHLQGWGLVCRIWGNRWHWEPSLAEGLAALAAAQLESRQEANPAAPAAAHLESWQVAGPAALAAAQLESWQEASPAALAAAQLEMWS